MTAACLSLISALVVFLKVLFLVLVYSWVW